MCGKIRIFLFWVGVLSYRIDGYENIYEYDMAVTGFSVMTAQLQNRSLLIGPEGQLRYVLPDNYNIPKHSDMCFIHITSVLGQYSFTKLC